MLRIWSTSSRVWVPAISSKGRCTEAPADVEVGTTGPCRLRSTSTHTDAPGLSATLSHMKVGVRDLRNDTARVLDAVRAGERVTLTVHGEPIADIVPHGGRTRWLSGAALSDQLARRAADPQLRDDLDELAGQTLADM
jgi:prevent-host-death family protein